MGEPLGPDRAGTGRACPLRLAERALPVLGATGHTRDPGATRLYVRDPKGRFRDQWTVPYLRSTTLPSDARYTGYRRDGKALWLAADERAMYAKDGDRVERWPRIPTGTGCA